MINCIIFDICDTLVRTAGVTGLRDLKGINLANDGEKIEQWFRSNSVFQAYESGEVDTTSFYNAFCSDFNIGDDKHTFCKIYESLVLREISGAATMIHYWHNRYPLFALSNNNPLLWKATKLHCTVLACFTNIFLSHEIKLLKPNPDAFDFVLNAIGSEPHETIFVDDNPSCITTAIELGMHGVHFKDAPSTNEKITAIIHEKHLRKP